MLLCSAMAIFVAQSTEGVLRLGSETPGIRYLVNWINIRGVQ